MLLVVELVDGGAHLRRVFQRPGPVGDIARYPERRIGARHRCQQQRRGTDRDEDSEQAREGTQQTHGRQSSASQDASTRPGRLCLRCVKRMPTPIPTVNASSPSHPRRRPSLISRLLL
ncbi:Uncharacterised protein [Mycobacteroides abscessus subsp. abscessus]|nr:Uncharacterised protein [Mycobacteroides abscessus subsp. abscessus]